MIKLLILATSFVMASAYSVEKPNILVIFGDDIGWSNISAYGDGIIGYKTPNIDSIAKKGIKFTDHYAQPSCTAGRAAFITGQYPIRSGMTTVGMPGSPLGLKEESPSLAEVLKEQGYATGQFGKNHLGDQNSALPTAHGFDEFFGNLYHLNTEEEFEQPDYAIFAQRYAGSLEKFLAKFGTRGVMHCYATDKFDETKDPRFGVMGKQKCEDTGRLGQERMKNFDRKEMLPAAVKFMAKAKKENRPFFTWVNTTRMHLYTHVDESWKKKAAEKTSFLDLHGAGMLQHDRDIGYLLEELKKQGLDKNTIIVYSTDNGPEHSSWPHGATTPFRGEKMTTYEGGVRVPTLVSWPGTIPEGKTLNGIQGHQDLFTTLAAAAGVKDVNQKMLKEKKQPIDGVDNLAYWKGESEKSARDHILYYFESQLSAIRMGPWKMHFSTAENYYSAPENRAKPLIFNLRMDPFESYDSVDAYGHLVQKVSWLLAPATEIIQAHIKSLQEYPPVQRGTTFDMNEMIQNALGSKELAE